MAGPGGTNEIVVRIVSGLKGDGDDVVRKTRERAKKVRDTELKEKETTEKAKERIAQRALARQRKLADKVEADAHKAKLDHLKSEDKFEASLYTRKNKRRHESFKMELDAQKRAHKNELFLFDQRLAISKKAMAAAERAKKKKEADDRRDAKKAERESPEYLQRAGYMGARARMLRKQGAEAYKREHGLISAADQAAPRVKGVPLTYSQRRARAAAEREQYLTETYGSPRSGRFALRQERAQTAVEAAMDQRRIMRRRVLTGDTGRFGVSPTEMFKQGMAPDEQLQSLKDLLGKNPIGWVLKTLGKFATAAITIPIGMGYARAKQGVAMNRSFGRAQAELAGMEAASGFRQYNIGDRRYSQAAAMGRSPQDLLRARVASLKGAGGGVSDIETLALMVNAQMGAGDAAQMMSMSMMRGNKGKDIKKDINRTFAIGVAAGFKEIARQPIFAKSFAEYLSKGHVAGATREGAGSLLAAFTKAAPGGAISGLYGLDLIDKLQSGMAGPDPQSALAAFQRYLIGYGRPGSTMDYFQAEDIRAGGIHERPELVKNIKDTIRSITRGSGRQSRFMLRNVYGMTQPQAREFLSVGDILPVPAGGEDKFRPETAAARTPPSARRYARQDLALMRATVRATKSFDHFDDVMTELAATNEELISTLKDTVADYLRSKNVTAQHEGAKKVEMPPATKTTADAELNVKGLTAERNTIKRYLQRDDITPTEREAALQRLSVVESSLDQSRTSSTRAAVARGLEKSLGPASASVVYPHIVPEEKEAARLRGQFVPKGIEQQVAAAVNEAFPGARIGRVIADSLDMINSSVQQATSRIKDVAKIYETRDFMAPNKALEQAIRNSGAAPSGGKKE